MDNRKYDAVFTLDEIQMMLGIILTLDPEGDFSPKAKSVIYKIKSLPPKADIFFQFS